MRSCRAPIASLDCMEEFNGGGGGGGGGGNAVDSGVHCSNTTGTKEQLLTNCIAAQAQRLQHPSPGIRYRNLGKSGLRVSNVGLGTLNVFPTFVETNRIAVTHPFYSISMYALLYSFFR